MRDINDKKKGFNKCIDNKRKTRKYVGLLLNKARKPVAQDIEKAELHNAFFASFFTFR